MTNQWHDDARFPGVRIHSSSYVDDPVTIGVDTVIWHFCHVLGGVTIGKCCSIGQNVMIGPNVSIITVGHPLEPRSAAPSPSESPS